MPRNALQKAFGGSIQKQNQNHVPLSLRECKMSKSKNALVRSSGAETLQGQAGKQSNARNRIPRNALQKAFRGTIQKQNQTHVPLSLRVCKMLSVECKMFKTGKALVCLSDSRKTDKNKLESPKKCLCQVEHPQALRVRPYKGKPQCKLQET
jgi:hypothetical protein